MQEISTFVSDDHSCGFFEDCHSIGIEPYFNVLFECIIMCLVVVCINRLNVMMDMLLAYITNFKSAVSRVQRRWDTRIYEMFRSLVSLILR